MQILIAGKQKSLRSALKGFLQTRYGYIVVGTASTREALFDQVESKSPDLILLDENLSERLVERIIVPLQQHDPCPRTIVLGSWPESEKEYLDAGASAFTTKSDPPKSLLTTIERILPRRNRA